VRGWPEHARVRGGGMALAALGPVALIVWLPGGPLGSGWARRSGTPASLLVGSTRPARSSSTSASRGGAEPLGGGFTANLSGTVKQGPGPAPGEVSVQIAASFTATVAGRLEIEIDGPAVRGGGVALRSSSVTLGSPPTPVSYHGSIVALDGNRVLANVGDAQGHRLSLQIVLAVDTATSSVTGTLAASPVSR
jgi:hypothetical protein